VVHHLQAIHMQQLDHKVLHLQLVNALTTNDTDTILNSIFKLNSVPVQKPTYGSPLHLVVSICDTKVVQNVVSVFCSENSQSQNASSMEWINSFNSDKETPLHICSKLGRQDIMEMLLQIPTINDTLRNADGKTAHEVCQDPEMDIIFTSLID
jgi:ankyrin repeat protein